MLARVYRLLPERARRVVRWCVRQMPGRRVRWGNMRRSRPFSDRYGAERGLPVDRFYIEAFLREHGELIHGEVLEVKDAEYSTRFGRPERVHVVDVDPGNPDATLVADLNIEGSLRSSAFDCVILTQVLQYVRPVDALRNVWAGLAPGGSLLVTAPAAARIEPGEEGSDAWRFTPLGLRIVLRDAGIEGSAASVSVSAYGNLLACICALAGLAVEDVSPRELEVSDPRFPLIVAAVARKPADL